MMNIFSRRKQYKYAVSIFEIFDEAFIPHPLHDFCFCLHRQKEHGFNICISAQDAFLMKPFLLIIHSVFSQKKAGKIPPYCFQTHQMLKVQTYWNFTEPNQNRNFKRMKKVRLIENQIFFN